MDCPAVPEPEPHPHDRRDDLIEFALEHEALIAGAGRQIHDEKRYYVSESSAYRILKEAELITAPNYVMIKAAEEFKDKTTAINRCGKRTLPTSRSSVGLF